ncbi:PREDICTED: meiosis-specific kinetochore protein isoform X2 [Chinchilla lanigera]|uniref:Meiotic kinetochore factor n=1 Tax=Chinchilla lanigera TaxID=34839 RepID=A0A8C2VVP2_CHILA|nr:PREDICTED: meiosis-specific kinetochore protein isoform X2 [Chinchilla lanigera]
MALWPLRVYTRKKRAGPRLNLTPALDLGPPATSEAPPGPGPRPPTALRGACPGRAAGCGRRGLGPGESQGFQGCCPQTGRAFTGPTGKGRERGLPEIAEKAEWGGPGGGGSQPPSTKVRDARKKSLSESNTCEETQNEIAPWSESVTNDLQVDSSSSNSELVSGSSLQHDTSSSLLSYSATESYTEYNSVEENLSSFSSPELFRGSSYLDWECPKLTEHVQCKNSTLLDTSKAVGIEKVSEFSNLSAILDNADCEVLLAEKISPATSEETKKNLENDLEDRDTDIQTKLNHRAHIDIELSHHRPALGSSAHSSVTGVLLPQPLAPALKTNSCIPNKKSRGLLTSTPSSEAAGFVFPSNRPEICCIIKASPGTRKMKSKGVTIKKKRDSPPQDIPQDIIIKTNGRI